MNFGVRIRVFKVLFLILLIEKRDVLYTVMFWLNERINCYFVTQIIS